MIKSTRCNVIFMKKIIFSVLSLIVLASCSGTPVSENTDTDQSQETISVDKTITFSNVDLGLGFDYTEMSQQDLKINTTVDGNKVTLTPYDDNSWVHTITVLTKGATESPSNVIKGLISGADVEYCEASEFEKGGQNYSEFLITTTETFETETGKGMLEADCGLYRWGFFRYYETAPTKLVYIEIGQDTFMKDEKWLETLSVVDMPSL